MADPAAALAETRRVLRDGGRLVVRGLGGPGPEHVGGDPRDDDGRARAPAAARAGRARDLRDGRSRTGSASWSPAPGFGEPQIEEVRDRVGLRRPRRALGEDARARRARSPTRSTRFRRSGQDEVRTHGRASASTERLAEDCNGASTASRSRSSPSRPRAHSRQRVACRRDGRRRGADPRRLAPLERRRARARRRELRPRDRDPLGAHGQVYRGRMTACGAGSPRSTSSSSDWELGIDEVRRARARTLDASTGAIRARGRQSGVDPRSAGELARSSYRRDGRMRLMRNFIGRCPRRRRGARVSDQRLLDRFVRLCEIPSPTGAERAVADDVLGRAARARRRGQRGRRRAARRAPAPGNLIARVPGDGGGVGDVLRPPRHGPAGRAGSRSSSPTASIAAAARRSSAPTTRRR